MKKYKKWLGWGIFLIAVIALLVFVYYGSKTMSHTDTPVKYSVILYQYTDNSWGSLNEGIEQASRDYNVNISYVTMAIDAKVEEQRALIDREIENGAQGLLVAAVDSEGLKDKLLEIEKKIPVVTVETGVGEEITHIAADDYKMGYELGEKLLEDYKGIGTCQVAVIKEYMERLSVAERYRGLMDALKSGPVRTEAVEWIRGAGDYNLALYLKTKCSAWAGKAVVALDKYSMEELIEGGRLLRSEQAGQEVRLPLFYGIGNTDAIVNGLDQGEVQALVYQNEFNAGYQGMETLIQKKRDKAYSSRKIKYQMVTKDTLYETENQRLLFPIV